MAIALHQKFIAGVISLAVLVTSFSANEARASDFRTEHALAAILGLAVVGAVIADEKKKKRKRKAAAAARHHAPKHDVKKYHPPKHHAHPKTYHAQPKPLPSRAHRYALPAHCLRHVDTQYGPRKFYGLRCMNQSYGYVASLPQDCARVVHTARGARSGWSAACLRHSGYKIAHH